MEARPPSSRSSSSSSTNAASSSTYKTPVAPKNIARLGRTTSSLGAPIDINITNNEEFKIPSLPDRSIPTRRPLMMARPDNLDAGPLSPDALTSSTPMSATPSRLKRLSLLARSPILDGDNRNTTTPTTVTSPRPDENSTRFESSTSRLRTSTDGSSTPRRTGMGIRSSISYSSAASRTPTQDGFGGRGMSSEGRISVDSSEGRDLMGLFEDNEEEAQVKGETLTDRHAELLTAIAQKERRVNELKQELETEQAALQNLKSRWSNLISSVYPSSNTTPMQASSSRDQPSTTKLSSPDMSIGSEVSPETQPGFQSLLQDVLGGAPLVDPDVMEGGRRFIGNLMKTVGAAAGGTVPETNNDKGGAVNGIDLSSIGKMFSWGSSQPTNTVRIRPSDSGSSIKGRRSPPATTSAAGLNESESIPPRARKESYRDLLSD